MAEWLWSSEKWYKARNRYEEEEWEGETKERK